ncbi:hypothetical protein L484_011502 [Morus notabilis]|uniref:Uncharacterized protein n=1 Tax=Morus notabilis TaxID=981085 RepID=W9R957_9ROSA|nr:hypothetical protein L484_011502 [Morus notabilis]
MKEMLVNKLRGSLNLLKRKDIVETKNQRVREQKDAIDKQRVHEQKDAIVFVTIYCENLYASIFVDDRRK